jgi:hypothetical protein
MLWVCSSVWLEPETVNFAVLGSNPSAPSFIIIIFAYPSKRLIQKKSKENNTWLLVNQ